MAISATLPAAPVPVSGDHLQQLPSRRNFGQLVTRGTVGDLTGLLISPVAEATVLEAHGRSFLVASVSCSVRESENLFIVALVLAGFLVELANFTR